MWGWDRKICPLGSAFVITWQALWCLVMPKADPLDGFFCTTLIIESIFSTRLPSIPLVSNAESCWPNSPTVASPSGHPSHPSLKKGWLLGDATDREFAYFPDPMVYIWNRRRGHFFQGNKRTIVVTSPSSFISKAAFFVIFPTRFAWKVCQCGRLVLVWSTFNDTT